MPELDLAPEEDAISVVEPSEDESQGATHRLLGLTDAEYEEICRILDREPRPAELAMYSVMWSEHCSYKSSRIHLSRFPTEAPWVVVGPGENAGVVDIGGGWLAAIRIESHNHPSFVEPYQGAATGVGGILRDVFTMGARPIALWDQIRFGPLDNPKNRYLFGGVVAGIAGYGNAVGVPTVGGETSFAECYGANPLVNVMCLGIMHRDELVLGTAGEPGNVAVLLGNATGRDGIGGASVLASASFDHKSADKRPSVQVGDPFEEKKLIEACLELYRAGLVAGVQDLGAAGLSCATSEPAARAGTGMEVDLSRVHTREPDMTPAELLMSESQERMLAFVTPEKVDQVLQVAKKWEIDATIIGKVRAGNTLEVFFDGEKVAEVPAASLADAAPKYSRPMGEPAWMEDLWSNTLNFMTPPDIVEALLALLDDPSIASARWIYEQYDHMLFLNTMLEPGHDASLLRVKGADKALAVTTDGNGRLCYLDPWRGAARLVYESALNLAMVGATPLAVVDNLNFGNPEKPEVMWQLAETIDGISEACEAIGIPVIGGNVSLYNETDGVDIYPTPVIGMLGLIEPVPAKLPRLDGVDEGMEVWLLGPERTINLAGSSFEQTTFSHVGGRPSAPDPSMARAVMEMARRLVTEEIPAALHDISDGGLAVALAELCVLSNVGATVEYSDWRHLFSEEPHRFLAAMPPGSSPRIESIADELGVPATRLGTFGGTQISMKREESVSTVPLEEAKKAYLEAIPRRMSSS